MVLSCKMFCQGFFVIVFFLPYFYHKNAVLRSQVSKQLFAGSRCWYSTKMKGKGVFLTKILFLNEI